MHDDIIPWKNTPYYRPFVRRIDELSVDSLPQMPVPQSFDHLFVVRLNKLLKKNGGRCYDVHRGREPHKQIMSVNFYKSMFLTCVFDSMYLVYINCSCFSGKYYISASIRNVPINAKASFNSLKSSVSTEISWIEKGEKLYTTYNYSMQVPICATAHMYYVSKRGPCLVSSGV